MDTQSLTRELDAQPPCGVDLEDTQQMAAIDAFRVFGQTMPLKADIDWRAIREAALDALGSSRDLRLLAHLAAAQLRIEGLHSFIEVLGVAKTWLTDWFDAVYPRIDDDAVLRKNALNGFADRMAVVDALRRVPLVSHRQLGAFSLRQVEIAAGSLAPSAEDGETPPTESQIFGAFSAAPQEELAQLVQSLNGALDTLKAIDAAMVASGDVQASPDVAPLRDTLARMRQIVAEHVRDGAGGGEAAADGDAQGEGSGSGPGVPGQIRNRQDAMRSLDAIAEFFRRTEPSSPVPMFIERAKSLVSKNFLEVMAELAPESLSAVKHVGGIRDQSDDE